MTYYQRLVFMNLLKNTLEKIELEHFMYANEPNENHFLYRDVSVKFLIGNGKLSTNYNNETTTLWVNPKDVNNEVKLRIVIKSIYRKLLPF